jgi:hypothetical protein
MTRTSLTLGLALFATSLASLPAAAQYDPNIAARASGPTGLSQGASDLTNPVFEDRLRYRSSPNVYVRAPGYYGRPMHRRYYREWR